MNDGAAGDPLLPGRQEACKTFLDQTKQLMTLASTFLFAPAAFITLSKDLAAIGAAPKVGWFFATEAFFVLSVILGYVTIGTIAGTQHDGTYDVYRVATRRFALAQFSAYVLGLITFAGLILSLRG